MQIRKLSIALLALLATSVVVGVSSASAYTVSPQGPFKAIGFDVWIEFFGPKGESEVQEKLVCNAEVLEGTIGAPSRNSQFSVSPQFYGCESYKTGSHPNGLGPVTIKQSLTSVYEFGMNTTYAWQGVNLQVTRTNYPACTFNLQGRLTYPIYQRNSAGEIIAFWPSGYQYLEVANSVTPAEHCPQLYPNGFKARFSTEPFFIDSHPLKIQ